MIQPGKLVRTTRAQIGVPRGTMGLVTQSRESSGDYSDKIHTVQLIGVVGALGQPSTRRFMCRDLKEATNASR